MQRYAPLTTVTAARELDHELRLATGGRDGQGEEKGQTVVSSMHAWRVVDVAMVALVGRLRRRGVALQGFVGRAGHSGLQLTQSGLDTPAKWVSLVPLPLTRNDGSNSDADDVSMALEDALVSFRGFTVSMAAGAFDDGNVVSLDLHAVLELWVGDVDSLQRFVTRCRTRFCQDDMRAPLIRVDGFVSAASVAPAGLGSCQRRGGTR